MFDKQLGPRVRRPSDNYLIALLFAAGAWFAISSIVALTTNALAALLMGLSALGLWVLTLVVMRKFRRVFQE